MAEGRPAMEQRQVLVNAIASTAGGGRTYLRQVLPRLAARAGRSEHFTVLVPASMAEEYRVLLRGTGGGVTIEPGPVGGVARRWWWEQTGLRDRMVTGRYDLLLSLGNLGLLRSPAPQILFNRSDLLFSRRFRQDLRERGEWRMWLENQVRLALASLSIRRATLNLTPTRAFADRIREIRWLREVRFEALSFGVDRDRFQELPDEKSGPPPAWWSQVAPQPGVRRLLYVSHYNYFRNFEALLRALPAIRDGLARATGEKVELILTTKLERGAVYGGYDATGAAGLVDQLGIGSAVRMLGEVPWEELRWLYRSADLFVCPSYAESFGHPLVEAMASGLPVLSADLPVHREVCGDAAGYFSLDEEGSLAERAIALLLDGGERERMAASGRLRVARLFSWDDHVERLLGLIREILSAKPGKRRGEES